MYDVKSLWYENKVSLDHVDHHSFEKIQTTPYDSVTNMEPDVSAVAAAVWKVVCVREIAVISCGVGWLVVS